MGKRKMPRITAVQKLMNAALFDPDDTRDAEEILTDALTDLRHWADSAGEDFDVCLGRSRRHHIAEKAGDNDL